MVSPAETLSTEAPLLATMSLNRRHSIAVTQSPGCLFTLPLSSLGFNIRFCSNSAGVQ